MSETLNKQVEIYSKNLQHIYKDFQGKCALDLTIIVANLEGEDYKHKVFSNKKNKFDTYTIVIDSFEKQCKYHPEDIGDAYYCNTFEELTCIILYILGNPDLYVSGSPDDVLNQLDTISLDANHIEY